MKTIEVNGRTYSIGQLDARAQFHVSRRIAPILASMGISLATLRAGATINLDQLATSLGPVSEVVANMSDETVDYIIATCFSVVSRKQDEVAGKAQWAPAARGAQMMFADINMPTMLRIVVAVLQENLMDFLQEPAAQGTSAGS